uniref:Armadillo/beta-catenin repeat family protein n=1 Tax=Rhizophora mucronata TaxID=61149 RepID=A0A2P2J3B5_RHIMU
MGEDEEAEEEAENEKTAPLPATATAKVTVIGGRDREEEAWNLRKQIQIVELADKLSNGDLHAQIEAARGIRKLVRKSFSGKARSKFAAAGVIQPLVLMLLSPNVDAQEASLVALLNLAVRNERYPLFIAFKVQNRLFDCCFRFKLLKFYSVKMKGVDFGN